MIDKLLAAEYRLGPIPRENLGPIAVSGNLGEALSTFNKVLSNIIGLLTVIAGIWFIFQFVIGAFSYLTAGGDKAKTQEAQQKITTGLVGLVIVVAAIFLIDLIGGLLGIDILNPGAFVEQMWPGPN